MALKKTKKTKKMKELDGCFNKTADLVKRKNETWSDTNLENEFKGNEEFTRLECRNCKGIEFEVLKTRTYETSAKCCNCKMYYIIHCG